MKSLWLKLLVDYYLAMKGGNFYKEPIGEDYNYPDW